MLGGGADGFGRGGLVAVGEGGGGSASTDRVGEGNGEVDGLVLEFSFALALASMTSLGFSLGSGEADTFAFWFAFAFWLVLPPAGIPASDSPVAGVAGSTGLLLGSAARVEPVVVASVGWELRESA